MNSLNAWFISISCLKTEIGVKHSSSEKLFKHPETVKSDEFCVGVGVVSEGGSGILYQ